MFCGFVDYHKLCLFCTLADENQVSRIICSSNCANRSLFPDCGNILIYKSTGLNLQDGMVGCTQSKIKELDSHNFMEVIKVKQNFIFNTSDTSIIDIFFYLTGNL